MFLSTDYSLFQSSASVKKTVAKMKELEYTQAVIADDKMFGTMEFYYACKKVDIKPIISVRADIEGSKVILIAKNFKGYRNLSALSKIEAILVEDFVSLSENVIVVFEPSNANVEACSYLKDKLLNKEVEMFLGVKVNFTVEEDMEAIRLKKELGLREIPCEISTHVNKEDYRSTTSLMAVGQKETYDKTMLGNNVSPENFIKEKSYYSENFSRESLLNLKSLFDSCVDDYKFGDPTPPGFKFTPVVAEKEGLPSTTTDAELFTYLSRKGLEERLRLVDSSKHQIYRDRLEYEIDIINSMKFPGYMLIVWDFVVAAKEMFIPVGPGRGSAAGSLVAFSLLITDIDPLPYGLLFERFLNPERVSMPDIDMDFCQTRRQEVIDYVADKYGHESVAQIITFGKMGGKASIKDAARILNYAGGDRLSKAIPETPGITLDKAHEQNKEEINAIIENEDLGARVWKYAHKLEGLNRNLGVHAAGLVISDGDLIEKCPIANVKGTQVVQYEGGYLEDVDLIKFDFLGLKTLSVIDSAIKMIKENKGIDIDFRSMTVYEDKKVYEDISSGETGGLFQIESSGMQGLCKRLKPDCFEDLIAILALYRPGPMESGMLDDFIARKNGEAEISYFFKDMEPVLEPILKPTYGVIVYQEQVMQIVQEIGGFSLGESDIIRRAMGKKQIAYMEEKKIEFADRAEKKGYKREEAMELFTLIEKFAGYGFNKSHSAAYALVTYYTAFLKTYHPLEFMASLMNLDYDKQEKLVTYIQTTKRMHIEIVAPNVNTSTEMFSVKDGKISYGLRALKSAGANVLSVIKKRNKDGEYKNLADFLKRSKSGTPKLNKSAFMALFLSGALDSLASRSFVNDLKDEFISIKAVTGAPFAALLEKASTAENIFADTGSLSLEEMVLGEKEYLGHIYTSPFRDIQSDLDKFDIPKHEDYIVGKNKTIVWFEVLDEKISKKGNKYGSINMIDTQKELRSAVIFAGGLEFLAKNFVDISKPLILDFGLKSDGTIMVNEAVVYSRNELMKNFRKKEIKEIKKEVIEVKKEVIEVKKEEPSASQEKSKIKEITLCDFDALLSIDSEEEIVIIDNNNNSILKVYR